jgi:hypothetical protein
MGLYANNFLLYGVLYKGQPLGHPMSYYNFKNIDGLLDQQEKKQGNFLTFKSLTKFNLSFVGFVQKEEIMRVLKAILNHTFFNGNLCTRIDEKDENDVSRVIGYLKNGVDDTIASLKVSLELKGINQEPQWWFVEAYSSSYDNHVNYRSLPLKPNDIVEKLNTLPLVPNENGIIFRNNVSSNLLLK